MNLHYEPINEQNRAEATCLQVAANQMDFIETVAECLKEADRLSIWHPTAIYDDENMVGFAMFGFFPEEGTCGRLWLDRFLIDCHHQRKGYANQALQDLKELLFARYGKQDLFLSVKDETIPAVLLYQKHGFQLTGELDEQGEKLMVCACESL